MHNLAALTPLGASQAKTEQVGQIRISEVTDRALASVSCRIGQTKAFAKAATKLFKMELPGPGAWTETAPYGLIWTGPEQWFVEAPFASHEDIARIVKAGMGDTASITEQTDGWVRFDVEGARVLEMLERLCPVPSRQMKTGAATRTILEHMGCLVICRVTRQRFSLLAPRSYAQSLLHALKASALSVG